MMVRHITIIILFGGDIRRGTDSGKKALQGLCQPVMGIRLIMGGNGLSTEPA